MPIAVFIGVYSRVFWLGPITAFGKRGYRTSQIIFYFLFIFIYKIDLWSRLENVAIAYL